MKRIFLHIGLHKTGTTSLQDYLSFNSTWFGEQGYFVLPRQRFLEYRGAKVDMGSGIGGQHAIPNDLRLNEDFKPLDAFLSHFEASGKDHAIISTEGFDRLQPPCIDRLFSRLNNYEVSAILVLRHPLDLARSVYCSRGGGVKATGRNFLKWSVYNNRMFDYANLIDDWAARSDLKVVKYEDVDDSVETVINKIDARLFDLDKIRNRARESVPAHVAIALSDIRRAFSSDDVFFKTIYPYAVFYHETIRDHGKSKKFTPFSVQDQQWFLREWRDKVGSALKYRYSYERFSEYERLPDVVTPATVSDVQEFKTGFLEWVFNEKLPRKWLGINVSE